MQAKFSKLGVRSFSELALLVPHSYEDLRLSDSLPLEGESITIDATITSLRRTPSSLQVGFFAHNLGDNISGVLFNPKNYMIHAFSEGSRGYFHGIISYKNGFASIMMPKKVTSVGAITPKYKSAMRTDLLHKFITQNLTLDALASEGLKRSVASELLALHSPATMPPKEPSGATLRALKYTELFVYLRELLAKRRYFKAKMSEFSSYENFVKHLPFKLTDDQLSTIKEIRSDFESGIAARRIVVGDVGSGKTMVILAAAFMARKSILMAPTTILANQIYEEAKKFLSGFSIALVTNKSKKEDLKSYDFIIGTHALLYRDLPNVPLVMVDEQHRFGTQQRSLLAKLVDEGASKAHFLQFSATPIPRTQAMIESAYIDVSLIKTTPFTKDITSRIISKGDFRELLSHIQSEIKASHQVLLIYPLVEQSDALEYQSIEEARGFWEENFEGVYVTYGADKQKEQTLLEFRQSGNILVATTVVEVGISLPRLSTIIIVGAERLGLASLHQLRGRVSRTGLKGYCFLYTNLKNSTRLERFCSTSNGFEIAELDLEFRKSGDLLRGENQSGKAFRWVDLSTDADIIAEVKADLATSTDRTLG